MEPINPTRVLDVIQNHRALLDEFESYLKKGETDKLVIAVKGLMVSAAFLDELVTNPPQPLGPAGPTINMVEPREA